MSLDFSYLRCVSVLPRRVRLRICWEDSKLLEDLLKNSLLEVLMIIIVWCLWEANQFNESPKGMPIYAEVSFKNGENFLNPSLLVYKFTP